MLPPGSGDHAPTALACDVYPSEVSALEALHSLEHGAVWVAYDPDDEPIGLVPRYEGEWVLISPVSDLPAPVIVTAWGHQLWAGHSGDPRIGQFIRHFAGSPEVPEPGTCA
jgi:hypothetical protein